MTILAELLDGTEMWFGVVKWRYLHAWRDRENTTCLSFLYNTRLGSGLVNDS